MGAHLTVEEVGAPLLRVLTQARVEATAVLPQAAAAVALEAAAVASGQVILVYCRKHNLSQQHQEFTFLLPWRRRTPSAVGQQLLPDSRQTRPLL
jgi:hypothetical protein